MKVILNRLTEGNLKHFMRIVIEGQEVADFDDSKVNDVIDVFATKARKLKS